MGQPGMAERTVLFEMVNTSPKQRINHAHIGEDAIRLHWHKPDDEKPGRQGVVLSKEDFHRIMETNYWKKEENLEATGSEGTNLTAAEVHIGDVVFTFKKGKRTAQEEVSFLALRQVDGRLRRRVRDARQG